jgi:hypothetical protein
MEEDKIDPRKERKKSQSWKIPVTPAAAMHAIQMVFLSLETAVYPFTGSIADANAGCRQDPCHSRL